MRNVLLLWMRDVTAHFLSPLLYAFLVFFYATAGFCFLKVIPQAEGSGHTLATVLFETTPFWVMVLLAVTILSARGLAEEKRSGTIEMLVTAPVSDAQVVLGKYLASLTVFAAVMLPTAAFPPMLRAVGVGAGPLDGGACVSAYLTLLLVGAFYISMGTAVSSLMRNPIVAATVCFLLLGAVFLSGALARALPGGPAGQMLAQVSSFEHVLTSLEGTIDSRAVVFYASATCFMLFASVKALESRRWV